eukprot:jgi/Botrbrau1/20707/Bobra.0058s0036.1
MEGFSGLCLLCRQKCFCILCVTGAAERAYALGQGRALEAEMDFERGIRNLERTCSVLRNIETLCSVLRALTPQDPSHALKVDRRVLRHAGSFVPKQIASSSTLRHKTRRPAGHDVHSRGNARASCGRHCVVFNARCIIAQFSGLPTI